MSCSDTTQWLWWHLYLKHNTLLLSCSVLWHPGLPLGGRTTYITSKNRLRTPKLYIKDVPRTSENSLVRPKMDIETSCLQKKPAHIYQITWFMSRLRIGNSFILFIDHARTSHLTDFESFIDSQCRVGFSRKRNYLSVSSNRCEILHRHILTTALETIPARRTSRPWAIKWNGKQPNHYPFCLKCRRDTLHACKITFIISTRLRRN